MSKIECLVCKGRHFLKGQYKLDVAVDVYSTAHNRTKTSAYTRSYSESDIDINVDVDVDTDIYNEVDAGGELDFKIESDELYEYKDVYKYVCEDCGFIMSFVSEQDVESKEQERKRKEKENMYDWSNFGK